MFSLSTDAKDGFIEGIVCNENDIAENEMKNFDLGESKILLVKQKGKITAIGAKCSHYGAPLNTGALGDGRIRCPWHGACFNIATGDIEDFPGQDSLPCYQVTITDGQVKVRAKMSELKDNKRTKFMTKKKSHDERTFVIVGGGPSGGICAETIRQNGFTGRVLIVGKENALPYDRPKLSKVMDIAVEKLYNRPQTFYDDNDIETMLGVSATELNTNSKELTLNNGFKVKYDKIYIATGSTPRKLEIPGSNLMNIFTLRNFDDSHTINSKLTPESHVVVLGVSFIGLEAAAFCVKKAAKVTVIGRDNVPLKPVFGEAVGQRIMEFFQEQKIEFVMNSGIKTCNGNEKLESVELTDGTNLKADILIMGVGSTLNTEFLKSSGLMINKNGSIDTSMHLETSISDVYVGGDIANAPVFSSDNKLSTIGHYSHAQYHGKIAGMNMTGNVTKLKNVPFFWTMLFGKSFRYCGHGSANDVHIDGNLEELKFVAFYFDNDGKVIAMSSIQRDPVVAQFAEFLSQGKTLNKTQVLEDPYAWIKQLNV